MPPIRAHGSQLMADGHPFFAFGFNYAGAGPGRFYSFRDRSPRTLGRYIDGMAAARRMGANTLRIYLQLFDFIQRHDGRVEVRGRALANLRRVLDAAQRLGVYLDLTGNLVWKPGSAPRWYNRLPFRARWLVQARFWSAVSRAAAASPAILCYELTSEPAIAAGAPRWYAGGLGGFNFIQYVVRDAGTANPGALAREWIRDLRGVIRRNDPHHLIGLGLLPSTSGPFGPRNVAGLLDVLLVHLYPETGHEAQAQRVLRAFASSRKPLLIGETFMLHSNAATQRRFLLASRPHVSGVLSFLPPSGTARNRSEKKAAALYRANLRTFLSVRDRLQGKR